MVRQAAKLARDIRGYLVGNRDFEFLQDSLKTTAYPIDLEFTLQREHLYYHPKDPQGLPMREYLSAGRHYNPTRIAGYGLAHYNRYLRQGIEESRRTFLRVADWFMQSPGGLWFYEFNWGTLRAPWVSAMAQGEGISVLVRAWHLTREDRYLEQAVRATTPFAECIDKGGVLSFLDDGTPFLEEYPTARPAHVLNGFLYALIGLTDLLRIAHLEPLKEPRLHDLVAGLERHLSEWDLGYWSAYDLSLGRLCLRNPATVSYHRLHIAQLRFLGSWWSSRPLLDAAERWEGYERSLSNRVRAMALKMAYRAVEGGQW